MQNVGKTPSVMMYPKPFMTVIPRRKGSIKTSHKEKLTFKDSEMDDIPQDAKDPKADNTVHLWQKEPQI